MRLTPSAPRNARLDNAKVVLLVLVMVGHVLEPHVHALPWARGLYVFLYLFHMPAFVLVSGHLSRPWSGARGLARAVVPLLLPLVVFQPLFLLLDPWVYARPYEQGPLVPYWLLWFLVSLAAWRLLLPLLARTRGSLLVSVVAAVGIGLVPEVGRAWSLERTVVFMPFFLAGFFLPRARLESLLTGRAGRVAAVFILAGSFAVAVAVAPQLDVRWLYGSLSFDALGLDARDGLLLRAVTLVVGFLLALAFLALVPGREVWFTRFGGRTFAPYLVHGVVLRVLWGLGLRSPWAMPVALALCLATFAAPVTRVLQPLLEPLRRGR